MYPIASSVATRLLSARSKLVLAALYRTSCNNSLDDKRPRTSFPIRVNWFISFVCALASDAFIVLDDADVPAAAAAAVKARFHNAGQSCVCAKRFIVSEAIAKEFTERFVNGARALVVGDPSVAGTQMGPLARGDLRDALDRQVRRSLEAGAVLLAGGQAIEGPGNFYEPTVLGNTGPGMPVFDEETFGPLAAIAIAKDDADAVRLANATPFGLSVSVWSSSTERALTVAKGVTSGAAFINSITASDARVPFGGTKKSGYGRELASAGIREFTNTRTYWSVSVA